MDVGRSLVDSIGRCLVGGRREAQEVGGGSGGEAVDRHRADDHKERGWQEIVGAADP
jgi:hypothetical protein